MRYSQVGLLRNGALVAEAEPATLLSHFNTDSLETVFLKICEKQNDMGKGFTYTPLNEDNRCVNAMATKCIKDEFQKVEQFSGKGILLKFLKVKALVKKNFLQTVRRPA